MKFFYHRKISILAKIIGYVDIMLTMCFAQCICFYGCKQDYGAVSGSEYLDVYFLCRLVYLLCRLVYLFCRLADLSCHLLYLFCRLEDLSCRLVYLFCRVVYPWLYLVYFGDILKYGLDPGLNFGLWKKITPESPSSHHLLKFCRKGKRNNVFMVGHATNLKNI